MDDLQLLDDLVRDQPLPERSELARSRAALLAAMGTRPRYGRWVLTGAAAAAAVSVGSAAVLISRDGPGEPIRPPVVAGPATTGVTTTAEAPARAGFRLVLDSPESTQQTARQLAQELDAALRAAVPDASWLAVPGRYGEPAAVVKGWDAVKGEPGGPLFNGGGAIRLGDRRGSLALLVESDPALLTCIPAGADCAVSTGPGGRTLVRLTLTTPGTPSTGDPHVQLQARVGLADGRVLVIVHDNDLGPDGTPRTQWRAPLTLDQVTAIATGVAEKIRA